MKILVGLLRGTPWLYHLEEGGKDRLRREAKSKGLGEKRTLVSYYLFPSSYLNSGENTYPNAPGQCDDVVMGEY